jgi:transposase
MCSAPLRKAYPSDVIDEEWSLVVPYLTLMTEAAPQRHHSMRELFNVQRNVIRYGMDWRAMPNDFPPGRRRISSFNAGRRRDVLTRCRRTCGRFCAWLQGDRRTPQKQSSTA